MWLKYTVKHSSFCLNQPKQILFSATEFWPLKMSYPLWILSNFLFSHRTSCILIVFFLSVFLHLPTVTSYCLVGLLPLSSVLSKRHTFLVSCLFSERPAIFSHSPGLPGNSVPWWALSDFFFFFSDHTSWLMWSYFPNERSSSASLVKASNSNPWTTR